DDPGDHLQWRYGDHGSPSRNTDLAPRAAGRNDRPGPTEAEDMLPAIANASSRRGTTRRCLWMRLVNSTRRRAARSSDPTWRAASPEVGARRAAFGRSDGCTAPTPGYADGRFRPAPCGRHSLPRGRGSSEWTTPLSGHRTGVSLRRTIATTARTAMISG